MGSELYDILGSEPSDLSLFWRENRGITAVLKIFPKFTGGFL
jgi:hypothetical protein